MVNLTLQQIAESVTADIQTLNNESGHLSIYDITAIISKHLPLIPIYQDRQRYILRNVHKSLCDHPVYFFAKTKRSKDGTKVYAVTVSEAYRDTTVEELLTQRRANDTEMATKWECRHFAEALQDIGITLEQYDRIRRAEPYKEYYDAMLRLYRDKHEEKAI